MECQTLLAVCKKLSLLARYKTTIPNHIHQHSFSLWQSMHPSMDLSQWHLPFPRCNTNSLKWPNHDRLMRSLFANCIYNKMELISSETLILVVQTDSSIIIWSYPCSTCVCIWFKTTNNQILFLQLSYCHDYLSVRWTFDRICGLNKKKTTFSAQFLPEDIKL